MKKATTEVFKALSVIGDPITDEDCVVHLLESLLVLLPPSSDPSLIHTHLHLVNPIKFLFVSNEWRICEFHFQILLPGSGGSQNELVHLEECLACTQSMLLL